MKTKLRKTIAFILAVAALPILPILLIMCLAEWAMESDGAVWDEAVKPWMGHLTFRSTTKTKT